MKEIVMQNINENLTFEEGFKDYINDCKSRDLKTILFILCVIVG